MSPGAFMSSAWPAPCGRWLLPQVWSGADKGGRWQRLWNGLVGFGCPWVLPCPWLTNRRRPQLVASCKPPALARAGSAGRRPRLCRSASCGSAFNGIEAWRPLDGLPPLGPFPRAGFCCLPVEAASNRRASVALTARWFSVALPYPLPNTYDAEDFSPGMRPVALLKRYGLFPSPVSWWFQSLAVWKVRRRITQAP